MTFKLPELPSMCCDGEYSSQAVNEYGQACAKAALDEAYNIAGTFGSDQRLIKNAIRQLFEELK